MAAADYTAFVERMINRYEGGYGWDRGDSGGPTKYGITCYDLAEFEHTAMHSMSAWAPRVRAMTLAVADQIYKTKYATECDFDKLNPGCDCVVFDFGVNSGSSRAIRYAQQVVGAQVDGRMGPETLAKINAHDSQRFINDLCDERLGFLRRLGIWKEFGRGWTSRVRDLRQYSINLVPKPGHGLLETEIKPEKPVEKEVRIPKAYAKAFHKEDYAAIKSRHQGESDGTS